MTVIWLIVWLVFHTPQVLVFGAWNDWGIALAVCLAIDFFGALAANGRRGTRVAG
ncbi:MAG TPA: hypothetical protein VOB72_01275 [Candidatus Dormibacteraeota bacterium]|nr:hypothetical protein [Candidatus Dormibacteraeota bacterium]